MNPASAHATNNQPGAPINRDDSAEVMKIPEPIIEPITIIVPSSRPRPRTSLFDSDFFSVIVAGYYLNQSSEVNGNFSKLERRPLRFQNSFLWPRCSPPGTAIRQVIWALEDAFRPKPMNGLTTPVNDFTPRRKRLGYRNNA